MLLKDLVDQDRRRVSVLDDQEEVARMFGKYNLVAAPVVDTTDRLVGVITIDDVVDVIEEEADEDLKALGGVTSDEELSDSVWTIARARFNWLLVNLATAFLASSVLGLFEGQLEKMVALAVLAPIVASQGGNAATQTMTVAVRALATRELGASNKQPGARTTRPEGTHHGRVGNPRDRELIGDLAGGIGESHCTERGRAAAGHRVGRAAGRGQLVGVRADRIVDAAAAGLHPDDHRT